MDRFDDGVCGEADECTHACTQPNRHRNCNLYGHPYPHPDTNFFSIPN